MSEFDQLQPEQPLTVISASAFEEDHQSLARICGGFNWQLRRVRSCSETIQVLREAATPIAICEQKLPDGTWEDVLNRTRVHGDSPLLIVSSRAADEALWSEVLGQGGWDLLAKPFEPGEVRAALETAWKECRRRSARLTMAG